MPVQHLKIHTAETEDKLKVKYQQQLTNRQRYEQENKVSKSTGRPFQKFYIETKFFYTNQKISSECNDITFLNTGTTNVEVEGILLLPNQSLRIQGNIGELDTTEYQINFATLISTGNKLAVLRKLYT
jgi:hypothetical protein